MGRRVGRWQRWLWEWPEATACGVRAAFHVGLKVPIREHALRDSRFRELTANNPLTICSSEGICISLCFYMYVWIFSFQCIPQFPTHTKTAGCGEGQEPRGYVHCGTSCIVGCLANSINAFCLIPYFNLSDTISRRGVPAPRISVSTSG